MIGAVIIGIILAIILVQSLMKKKKKNAVPAFEVKSAEVTEPKTEGNDFFAQMRQDELRPLIIFIKKFRSKGVDDKEIKQALLKKGWDSALVNDAFKKV